MLDSAASPPVEAASTVPVLDLGGRSERSRSGSGGVVFLNWRDLRHPEGGGSELYVETVAARLAASGEPVTVFCAAHDQAPRDEVREGVRYVRRGSHLTVYLWAALLGIGARLGVSDRLGPHDVVVEVHNGVPFLARLWSSRPVLVLVHHVHREQWPVVFGPVVARLGWWLESRVAPRVNRRNDYVAVSGVTRDELAGLGVACERIAVVHNGTSPPQPTATAKTPYPSVVVLGRVVPHKRVELVLEAAAALRGQLPGLQVDVAGDGYWLPVLRERVAELGLEDVVTLHGRVDEQHKADLLARSWVQALPSLKEGWGLTVVEAGSHGTPSLAFRAAGGLAESIAHEDSGLLVDDVAGLQDALRRVLTDRDLRERLSEGARRRASRFSWSGTTQAFAACLDAARTQPRPRLARAPRARRPAAVQPSLSATSHLEE